MPDRLTIDDADGLRDLADRSRRAGRTAFQAAAAEETYSEARAMLLGLFHAAGELATRADALAGRLERGGPNRAEGADAIGSQDAIGSRMRGSSVDPTPDCGGPRKPPGATEMWWCEEHREFHAPAGKGGTDGS
jgi:hypothetical protein